MNPLDRYFKEYYIDASEIPEPPGKEAQIVPQSLKKKELAMWHNWDQHGRKPEHLRPLMKSIAPIIHKQIRTYSGQVSIPPAAIEAQFKTQAVKALKSFNPEVGVQLGTWVHSNIRKGTRFIRTYQNVGRIVESRIDKISELKNHKQKLGDQLGRPASDIELAKELGWSKAEVQRLNTELRNDVLSSKFEADPHAWTPSMDDEIFAHLEEELSPNERAVFTHLKDPTQTGGRTGKIAPVLGWSPSKVSKTRKSIERKARGIRDILSRSTYNPNTYGELR